MARASRPEGAPLTEAGAWVRRLWWVVIFFGLALCALGVAMLAHVATTTRVLAVLAGLYLIIAGLAHLSDAHRARANWLPYVTSIVMIIGGIVVVAWPSESLRVLEFVIGVTLIVAGAVRISAGLVVAKPISWWSVVVGLVLIIVGIIVLSWPGATIWVIGVIIGIQAIITGVEMVSTGVVMRRALNEVTRS